MIAMARISRAVLHSQWEMIVSSPSSAVEFHNGGSSLTHAMNTGLKTKDGFSLIILTDLFLAAIVV